MRATQGTSVLESLQLEPAQIESLSEADLCTLIGFIDDDHPIDASDDEEPPSSAGVAPS